MRIISWNVNGLRACAKKGFLDTLNQSKADIFGIQEVRAKENQLSDDILAPKGWHFNLFSAERAGYSGVGLYTRQAPDSIETSLGEERFDSEGRVQIARFGRLVVANIYFPNGSGKDRDNSRVPYKLDFFKALNERLQKLRKGGLRVVVMGDFNIAHKEIDLARPKSNRKTSGFLPEECEELDRWIDQGWIDSFRHFEKEGDHYTWWSQRFGTRERNVGWRIDYALISPSTLSYLRKSFIQNEIMGSDHCPIGIELDKKVLQRG